MIDTCACPACRRLLRLPEGVVEQEVRCPGCGEVFTARPESQQPQPHGEGIQSEPSAPAAASKPDRYRDEPFDLARAGPREWDSELEEWRPRRPESLPGADLTKALVVLLSINIVCGLGAIAFDAVQLAMLAKRPFGGLDEEGPLNWFGCLGALIYLPTAVVFCVWMHRSYKNLHELGVRGLRYSPAWAAGAFFVPILNLFRPCQIAQEMWRASALDIEEDVGHSWQNASGSGVIGGWWAFWLISNIAQQIGFRASFSGVATAESVLQLSVLGEGLSCVAGLFAILMVRGLRQRQEKKLEELLER